MVSPSLARPSILGPGPVNASRGREVYESGLKYAILVTFQVSIVPRSRLSPRSTREVARWPAPSQYNHVPQCYEAWRPHSSLSLTWSVGVSKVQFMEMAAMAAPSFCFLPSGGDFQRIFSMESEVK